MAQPERADCHGCRHYYVTYEMTRPHGCRHFGFVSRRLPSIEVRTASGEFCAAFEARPTGPLGGGDNRPRRRGSDPTR